MPLKAALVLAAGSFALFAPVVAADQPLITSCTTYTLDDVTTVGYADGRTKSFPTANALKKIDKQGGLPDGSSCGFIR